MGENEVRVMHPLNERFPEHCQKFEEFKEAWDKAGDNQAMMEGLLHDLGKNWLYSKEAVLFLLEIADGHTLISNFKPNLKRYLYDWEEMAKKRQQIARKAFRILCQWVFGEEKGVVSRPLLWWHWLEDEDVFAEFLWFIRLDLFGIHNHDCYERKGADAHHFATFETFLREFARLGLEPEKCAIHRLFGRDYGTERDEPVRERLVAAKPLFLRILCALEDYLWLSRLDPDPVVIAALEEVVSDRLRLDSRPKLPLPIAVISKAIIERIHAATVLLVLRARTEAIET